VIFALRIILPCHICFFLSLFFCAKLYLYDICMMGTCKSYEIPENTLLAFWWMGVGFIGLMEGYLQMTKDGEGVCRDEPLMGSADIGAI